jgi:hypothetical protein
MSWKTEYAEKLSDPRWQKKRLQVLERDQFQCIACSQDDITLHIHHIRYSSEPWETPLEHLETLCEWCHEARTDLDRSLKYLFGKKTKCPTQTLFWLMELWQPLLTQHGKPHRKQMIDIISQAVGKNLQVLDAADPVQGSATTQINTPIADSDAARVAGVTSC